MYSTSAPRNRADLWSKHRTAIECVYPSNSAVVPATPNGQSISHLSWSVVVGVSVTCGVQRDVMGYAGDNRDREKSCEWSLLDAKEKFCPTPTFPQNDQPDMAIILRFVSLGDQTMAPTWGRYSQGI